MSSNKVDGKTPHEAAEPICEDDNGEFWWATCSVEGCNYMSYRRENSKLLEPKK